MNHWLAVFNEVTWAQFLAMSPKVYAFSEPRDRRLPGIRIGDRLLCYVAKRMVWAGVLRVVGDRYRESTRIFAGGDFPIRYSVETEIGLTADDAASNVRPRRPSILLSCRRDREELGSLPTEVSTQAPPT